MHETLILAIIFAVFAIIAGIFLYRRPKQVDRMEELGLADIQRGIVILLDRGYDLGFVVFEIPGDQRFVEFSKYVRDETHKGVQLDFPFAPWSEPYYERVKGLLEGKGIPYQVEDTPDGPVREFIQVDFARDVDRAAGVAREIFERVFMLDPSTRLTADFQHVSPRR